MTSSCSDCTIGLVVFGLISLLFALAFISIGALEYEKTLTYKSTICWVNSITMVKRTFSTKNGPMTSEYAKYNVSYIIPINLYTTMSTTFEESNGLSKHPIHSSDTCYYDTTNPYKVQWKKRSPQQLLTVGIFFALLGISMLTVACYYVLKI
ncbi:unnamed protein product [Adineta steineri]|uniref:Uncharacterized protein n=1 Tax=Adineta steineri TaxID=433720 RepID=A0A813UEY3_9BILA|nr:unnamed protein product [Adineta steineri]CAF1236342.1 unnamed protein product [Adineta steineri]